MPITINIIYINNCNNYNEISIILMNSNKLSLYLYILYLNNYTNYHVKNIFLII